MIKAGSWTSILGIYLYGICGASTVSKIIPLAGDLTREFGLGAADFGWLISFIAVPAALLAIPSGIIVDRFGPRRILIAAAFFGMAANLIYLFGQSFPVLQAARLVEGVAIVHFYTAGPAMLMATTDGPRRTRAMTVWATYMPVGTSTGLLLGGLFAASGGWRTTFLLHGGLLALTALFTLFQPEIERMLAAPGAAKGLKARVTELRLAYTRPALLCLALGFFLVIGLGLGANITFPDYFARVHQISTSSAANMVALTTLAMVPGSLLAGAILSTWQKPHQLFLLLGVVSFIVGTLSFMPGFTIPARYVVTTLWFVATGAAVAVMLAILPLVAEPHRRGAAAALLNQAGALATFVNPPIWRLILAGGDWTPFAMMMAGGWTFAVLFIWFAMRVGISRPATA